MKIILENTTDIVLVKETKIQLEELNITAVIDLPKSRQIYVQLEELNNQILICSGDSYDEYISNGFWTYRQIESSLVELYTTTSPKK